MALRSGRQSAANSRLLAMSQEQSTNNHPPVTTPQPPAKSHQSPPKAKHKPSRPTPAIDRKPRAAHHQPLPTTSQEPPDTGSPLCRCCLPQPTRPPFPERLHTVGPRALSLPLAGDVQAQRLHGRAAPQQARFLRHRRTCAANATHEGTYGPYTWATRAHTHAIWNSGYWDLAI